MTTTSAALPAAFVERMGRLLGDELPAFVASFDGPRTRAIRRNPAKVTGDELAAILGVDLTPVPWCPTGYQLPDDVRLGGHPAHLAGLFYLQEPSAMAVIEALAPDRRSTVIDLAAAPGGKATHLAAACDQGLVVANEIDRARLGPLHDNVDLWGTTNVTTTSASIGALADGGLVVDAAVLDAPCTGEALFRRDPDTIRQWSPARVDGAARRQAELLDDATRLVRPGGALVYSTCSFEPAENEDRVAELVERASDHGNGRWRIVGGAPLPTVSPGFGGRAAPTERAVRLWPHRQPGEGQFVAILERVDDSPNRSERQAMTTAAPVPAPAPAAGAPVDQADTDRSGRTERTGRTDQTGRTERTGRGGRRHSHGRRRQPAVRPTDRAPSSDEVLAGWAGFAAGLDLDLDLDEDRLEVVGDRVHLRAPAVTGVAPARPGLPLGRLRPGRFEPAAALATSTVLGQPTGSDAERCWIEGDQRLAAYLRGETVTDPGPDGWVLIRYRRWGLGWARRRGGVLKNAVPRHRRQQAAAHQRRVTG